MKRKQRKHGEYIHLIFEYHDHPHYIKGHVTKDDAQKEISQELGDVSIDSVSYKYARLVRIGPEHEDYVEGCDSSFRVIDNPRASYYPVTECIQRNA